MAVDAYCDNCHENLGKVTENGTTLYCGTCGHEQDNWELKSYYPKIYIEAVEGEKEFNNQNNHE